MESNIFKGKVFLFCVQKRNNFHLLSFFISILLFLLAGIFQEQYMTYNGVITTLESLISLEASSLAHIDV